MNAALLSTKTSTIRAFTRLALQTPGCISLTLGEPDFDTPEPIRSEAKRALDAGDTHYIENNGSSELRQAISNYERCYNGMDYEADEVIVTAGATEALFISLFGILNPGDEVIVPTPAFGLYESIVKVCRGIFVPLPTENHDFQITQEMLRGALSPRTKAIVLNSPNNPTGSIYTFESLQAIHDTVIDKDIFVVCDDVYRQLIYTRAYHSFAEFRDLRRQLIVVQSFSKPYAMTGWRVGYLMADRRIVKELAKLHQFCVVSAPSTAQRACIAALKFNPEGMRETYRKRRDFALQRLKQIGLSARPPEGAFYLFPSIHPFEMDSAAFCTRMIHEAKVAAVPGICFGNDCHIRLSYCYNEEILAEAFNRLERYIRSLRKEYQR